MARASRTHFLCERGIACGKSPLAIYASRNRHLVTCGQCLHTNIYRDRPPSWRHD